MICLRLLGPIELAGPDGAELRSLLAQPKRTALLAYLAVEAPRGFQRRDTLLGLFWPDFDEQRARAALSRALHFLRRGLGDAALPGRGDGELTVDASLLWCDVVAFDAARAAGDHAAALALYRGELLEGFVPDEIPEFERWLERERRRLRLAASASAAATADAREAAGDLAGAVAASRRRVALDPHDEPALRALLTLLDRSGDRAGALAVYETAVRQLRDDLAVEPSAETRATADAIRAGSGRPASPPLPVAPAPAPAPTVPAPPPAPVEPAPPAPAPVPGSAPAGAPRRWARLAGTAALALVLVAATAWWARGGRMPQGPGAVRSIAVLPFRSLGGDSAGAYLGDGMSEEILTALSRLPGLAVVGRASSFRFRAPDVDPRQVGRELDAGALLTGTVQRAGGMVRVSAELVDTRTGRQLWSQTFDRPMGDLFALEDEIARAITDALRVRLAGGALVRRGTTSPAAHDLVLRAKALYRQADEASVERAVSLYGQALALDSGYAAAWAGLSSSYGQLADAFRAPTEMVPLAERAALRAVALDDSLAAAHVALAEVRGYWQWRFPDMRRELARALALDPSSTEAHLDHAIYLELIEEDLDGAERAIQAAAALDPFNPAVALRQMSIAELRGEAERAMRLARRTAQLAGGPYYYQSGLTAVLHANAGRWRECARAADSLPPASPAQAVHAVCLARLGELAGARAIRDRLLARRYTDRVMIAEIELALGDREAALSSLERAVEERSSNLISIRALPLLRPLRDEPRWRAVLARVGLPLRGPPARPPAP